MAPSPVKVVLKASKAFHRAEVLVDASVSIARRQLLLPSDQNRALGTAADLARGFTHRELGTERWRKGDGQKEKEVRWIDRRPTGQSFECLVHSREQRQAVIRHF